MKTRIAIALLALSSVAAFGQIQKEMPEDALPLITPAATPESTVDTGQSQVEVNATTDDSNATIKLSNTKSSGTETRGKFAVTSFSATAPLAKSGETDLASTTGFNDAFTATLKYSSIYVPRKPFGPSLQHGLDLCTEMRARAVRQGLNKADADALECDGGNFGTYANDLEDEFITLFFDPNRATYAWGVSATAGHQKFDFLQSDATKGSTSKTPWGVSGYIGMMPPKSNNTLVSIGGARREKWADADDTTLCPTGTGAVLTCQSGPGGPPVKNSTTSAFVEVRSEVMNRAFMAHVEYDFHKKKLAADIPIYIIPAGDSGFGGGVRVQWTEAKAPVFGVFVSKVFSIFPE